jgi:lactoylglutathione lyase
VRRDINQLKPLYCPHPALATDDRNRIVKMIEQHNLQLIKGPLKIEGKATWLYITDPDNNVIEFVQWFK